MYSWNFGPAAPRDLLRRCRFCLGAGLAVLLPSSAGAVDLVINGGASQTVTTDASYDVISIGQGGAAGSLTLNSGNLVANGGGVDISVGNAGAGTLTINGGTLTGTQIAVGNGGTGDVTQTAGTVTAGSLSLSAGAGGPTGTYAISGGSLSINSGGQGLTVGAVGTGTLTISGGSVSVNAANGLVIGSGAGSSGTVNLDGGTLTATKVSTGGGTSTLNFNGGTLVAGSTTTSFLQGLDTVQIRDGGATIDSNGHNITIAQSLTHSALGGDAAIDGGLTLEAGGAFVTLSGTNTYTGGTRLGVVRLNVSSDANLGDAAGGVTFTGGLNGGTLVATSSFSSGRAFTLNAEGKISVSSGQTLTLSGVISSPTSYGIEKTGTGTLVLSGQNTYQDKTSVAAGTLLVSSDGNLGDASASIQLTGGGVLGTTASFATNRTIEVAGGGGVLSTASGTTLTAGGAISGTGTLRKADNGILIFAANNSYSGATNVAAGTLQVGNGGTTGTLGTGNVTNNAALAFNRSNTMTVANAISGTGSVTQAGTGTTILTGANSYSGTTTISAGTLQVGNGGTTGTLGTGAVTNTTALAFNRSNALTVTAAISGTGTVTQAGTGTTILTGANSYSGTTTISAGTLQVGNGGTSGTLGTGNVTNNAALAFNRSDALSVANVISGTGTVTQSGTGNTVLTGTNTYTGTTTVNGGTLSVNGSIATSALVVVNSGGTLGGTGTLSTTTVNSGGTLAPGNSIGTLNVTGNVTFNTGSTYSVEVNSAGASDRLAVAGNVTINAGTTLAVRPVASGETGVSYGETTSYTILTATGTITGQFATVTDTFAFLDASVTYGATGAVVTLRRNDTTLASVGTTPNQRAAATGVSALGTGNTVYGAVLGLSAGDAAAAFDLLSGEIHATLETSLVEDSRFLREAAGQRLTQMQQGGAGSAWAQALGAYGSWVGDGNAAAASRSGGGILMGGDLGLPGSGGGVGLFAGYSRSGIEVAARRASAAIDNYHVGAYGGTSWGDLGLRFVGAYSLHDIATTRTAAFAGFSNVLSSRYWAGTGQLSGELFHDFKLSSGVSITPFANVAYVRLDSAGFQEAGGPAALSSVSDSADTLFTTIGIGAAGTIDIGSMPVALSGRIGWRHASADVALDRSLSFASGGPAFTVAGVPVARDTAVIDAEMAFAIGPAANLGLKYSGEVGSGISDHAFNARLEVDF